MGKLILPNDYSQEIQVDRCIFGETGYAFFYRVFMQHSCDGQ